jgi:N,N-dimethylformamidase
MKSPITRRKVLATTAAVAGATAASALLGRSAAAATATYDPEQRFLQFVGGANGIIYGVQADGTLMWYRHSDWASGGPMWANGGGLPINTGFNQFQTVLASADGQLFGVRANGEIVWYRYVLSDPVRGSGAWAPGSGSVIGTGFDVFARVIGGWDGVIYGLTDTGSMYWYRYTANDGTGGSAAWANGGNGASIGSGWGSHVVVLADPNGVIYGIRQGGELDWWRYVAGDGSSGPNAWQGGGEPSFLSDGFGNGSQKTWFTSGSGTFYVVELDASDVPRQDNVLGWYRLLNSETVALDGQPHWANGNGGAKSVGTGFTVEQMAALQGYADSWSVVAGGTLGVHVSTTFPTYSATLVRLAPASGDPISVSGPSVHAGRLQLVQSSYRSAGCGWLADFTSTIPSSYPSGVYAYQLTGPGGLSRYVPFIVRPNKPTSRVAVVIPTNTYNAYNTWGGHDRYTVGGGNGPRTVSLLRPSTSADVASTGAISPSMHSDLYLLRWMSTNQIEFDCYHDGDLDTGASWLNAYKVVVLASHPEYFSNTMRSNLINYISRGGRLINTGGNAIYDQVDRSPDGTALTYYGNAATGSRYRLFGLLGESSTQILGVDLGSSYMTFAPYVVRTGHPLLNGTGLKVGDRFGSVAYYGAASGWEVDVASNGIPAGTTLIAQGDNSGGGADMLFIDKGNGGWVFTVSSLAFNSSLPYDSHASTILSNAFNMAIR